MERAQFQQLGRNKHQPVNERPSSAGDDRPPTASAAEAQKTYPFANERVILGFLSHGSGAVKGNDFSQL